MTGKLSAEETAMFEFVEMLGSNVKTITYNTESENWTITYKNGLNPDEIASDDLIDFLNNG